MNDKEPQYSFLDTIPIMFVGFIGNLSLTIIIPFLIFIITDLGGSAITYSIVLSLYPASQAIGGIILGKLTDKYGRIPILFLSNLGSALSWALFFFSLFLPVTTLFVISIPYIEDQVITLPILSIGIARIVDGLTGGNVAVANSYLADLSNDESRARNFNIMTLVSNAGFLVGPAISTVLIRFFADAGNIYAIGFAILIAIAGTFSVPFFLTKEPSHIYRITHASKESLRAYLKKYKVVPSLILLGIGIFILNFFLSAIPAYVVKSLKWEEQDLNDLFLFGAIGAVIAIVTLMPFLYKKFSLYGIMFVNLIILMLLFIVMPFLTGNLIYLTLFGIPINTIYIISMGISATNSLFWSSLSTLIAQKAGRTFQGEIQGYALSISAICSVLGLLGGGISYDLFHKNLFFLSSGIIFLGICIVFYLWRYDNQSEQDVQK
jgi:DHA1 family tetracycline resistance protein-like MFS transporter